MQTEEVEKPKVTDWQDDAYREGKIYIKKQDFR